MAKSKTATFIYGLSFLVMIRDDAEFIARLIGFGLSKKEAQTYLHLLKYGPKTPSPLAKSLETYREDVHRTLTSLIEKGMVRPSLDAPTIYATVDLNTALEAALKKQRREERGMETRKPGAAGAVEATNVLAILRNRTSAGTQRHWRRYPPRGIVRWGVYGPRREQAKHQCD